MRGFYWRIPEWDLSSLGLHKRNWTPLLCLNLFSFSSWWSTLASFEDEEVWNKDQRDLIPYCDCLMSKSLGKLTTKPVLNSHYLNVNPPKAFIGLYYPEWKHVLLLFPPQPDSLAPIKARFCSCACLSTFTHQMGIQFLSVSSCNYQSVHWSSALQSARVVACLFVVIESGYNWTVC